MSASQLAFPSLLPEQNGLIASQRPRPRRRVVKPPRRHGVVLLDRPEAESSGWACCAGEMARRIRSPADLPTNVNWLLIGARAAPGLRSVRGERYLPVGPRELLGFFGRAGGSPSASAQTLAAVVGRIAAMAEALAEASGRRPDSVFVADELSADLAALVGPAEAVPDEVQKVVARGPFAHWVSPQVSDRTGPTYTFRFPRLAYVRELLDTPVPIGSLAAASVDAGAALGTVQTSTQPVYAQVSIADASPQPAAMLGRSAEANRAFGAAHPELLALDAFSVVHVHAMWSGGTYVPAIATLPEPIRAFLDDPASAASWSAGVVAEAIARAIMDAGRARVSWRALWLRAADRALMFSRAMALSEAGHMVHAYGLGWLSCRVPSSGRLRRDATRALYAAALRQGLLPDPSDVELEVFADALRASAGAAKPEHGWGRARILAACTLRQRKDLLAEADGLPLIDAARRPAALSALAEKLRRPK